MHFHFAAHITCVRINGHWQVCSLVYMMTSSNGNIFRVIPVFYEGNNPDGGFPSQGPVTRRFDGFFFCFCFVLFVCFSFYLRLKRWIKRSRRPPLGTSSRSLWRHCNDLHEPHKSLSVLLVPLCYESTNEVVWSKRPLRRILIGRLSLL